MQKKGGRFVDLGYAGHFTKKQQDTIAKYELRQNIREN